MSVTIKKIAEYAGVSIGTVSRALKNDPEIAEKTRKKIMELSEKLDYVPNNFGIGLQSKKSRLIGYMISNIQDSFYNQIIDGIGKELIKNSYGMLVAVTEDNSKSEIEQLRMFQEKSVDGIIISNYQPETVKYLHTLNDKGIKMVICDFQTFDKDIPNVITDDKKAYELIADHLIKEGHRSFAFCFARNDHALTRYHFCTEALQKKGFNSPVLCNDSKDMIQLMQSKQKPTAVICYSDYQAVEVKQTLEKSGYKIPNDVSITGFDDLFFASWPEFNLTTIYQPKMEIGKYAAEILLQMIKEDKLVSGKLITPELIIRKSSSFVNKL